MGCQASTTAERPIEIVEEVNSDDNDFHQKYLLDRKLGQGAFGSVFSARARAAGTGAPCVAVKVMELRAETSNDKRAERLRAAAQREIAVLRLLPDSANIVQFHGYYASGGLAYMVMENGGGGLLRALEKMEVLTEQTMQPVFRDMFLGIAACHAAGIVHRDVKPDNFLAAPTARGITVKLCDFGLASRVTDSEERSLEGVFGTPPFMAPEMLGGRRYSGKVDVWALGVLAYVLLYGAWPYTPTTMTGQAMQAAIVAGIPAPRYCGAPGVPKVSAPCAEWVQALLCREAASRPSARAALRHHGFSEWSAEVSMRPALSSAKRVGAFDVAAGRKPLTDLDRRLSRMNAAAQGCATQGEKANWTSEASTAADSRASRRY